GHLIRPALMMTDCEPSTRLVTDESCLAASSHRGTALLHANREEQRNRRPATMTEETVSATTTIRAPAETVFAVLADPSQHPAIDGTGWVRESPDDQRLTGSGQIFRMAMYHPNHPDGNYEMANRVLAFEPPRVISWQPGYVSPATGELEFGG